MAYTKTEWKTGDPITQERMNHIEDGIAAAQNTADGALRPDTQILSDLSNQVNTITALVGEDDAHGIRLQMVNLNTAVQQAAGSDSPGAKAWTQVVGATAANGSRTEAYDNLDSRFHNIELKAESEKALRVANSTQINNAMRSISDSLVQRFQDVEGNVSSLQGAMNSLDAALNTAGGVDDQGQQQTLALRLNAIDGGTQPTRTLPNVISEITDAHGTNNVYPTLSDRFEIIETQLTNAKSSHALAANGVDKAYDSIDARFEAIEGELVSNTDMATRIDTIQNNIDGVANLKVAITDIENNLSTPDTTTNHVLDARQGRVLNEAISALDTAYKAADTALTNRIDAIDNNSTGTVHGLDTRITTLETNINGAKVENGPQTLDARFDAVEDRATQLESDVQTIAEELNMLDEGTLTNIGSKIDDIEYAISHSSDVNDDTTGLTQHMTAAEGRLDTIETTIGASDAAGLRKRIADLESDVNDATTGLAATYAIAGAAATNADLTTLAGRVTTLENNPVSATVIVSNVTYNNDGIPTNIDNPSTDVDYLLKKDDQYYYWKYINNTWELISGGGGSGTSSAEFYSALTDVITPSDTVDYFIGSGTNYIHYRRYNNAWVQILPAHLINSVSLDVSPVSDEENAPTKSKPIIKEVGSNTNLLANFTAIKSIGYTQDENGTTLTWIDIDGGTDGVTITGGGGSASGATAAITRISDGNITTITGETCEIEFNFTATDSSGDTLATVSQGIWSINRARVATSSVVVGDNTFDITQYLHNGENNITLTVNATIDEQIVTRTKTWVVNVINFSLVWDYDESTINEGSTINFSCIPYGIDITKTLYFKVGANTQSQTVSTSGIPTTVSLANNFTHGVYTAEMWMTATINNGLKETDHIFHDFIVAQEGNNAPIIAATLPSTTMDQYNTLSIPFVVYTPNTNTSSVTLAVDGVIQDTREVGRTTQTWNYTPLTSGSKVLTITTGSVTKTLNLTVNSININNNEIGGYTFKLKASELPSNNALKNWYYDENNPTTTKLQFSNNFNWVNGGIKTELDENEQLRQYIRIKSGTTMTIPYKMFTTDPRINGMNFKIIFKIDNCRDYDATAATNIADNVGIQLDAHKATFKSSDTEISTQYGEEEYTELEFEVYKRTLPDSTQAPNRYMIEWIDGVMTTAREYGEGSFIQTNANAQNIVIGSTDCDICIYLIKYYPFALSRNDHITNFIADAPNAVEMIARYNRNDILDADEDIDYNKLAQKNRDCRVWLYDIDRMTTGKKDPVNVNKFQQIWENGDQYYQLTGENAKLTIQGTSSVNYRFGAANTDIDFRKSKAPNATLIDGYGNNLLSDDLDHKGFKINDDSIPIEYSNMKVNFASCEQVNNMCNAEWYQRYQPFPSLSARDCMEFAMGVQFIKDRRLNEPADGSIVLFNERGAEFNPEKYYMYSIGNLGNSKKNTNVFHSANECCIEIKENTSDAQKMKSFDNTWNSGNTDNYEMRYPDDPDEDIAAGWERFVTWMVANNPNAATGAALDSPVTFDEYTFRGHNRTITETEGRNFKQVLRGTKVYQYKGTYTHDTFNYRMAKMLSECEDYMAMDSVIYHFCFIERHTMVDNVAKNTFWSSVKEVGGPNDESGYWIWDLSKNYDNDTADGNNNNGELRLDYGNEAEDMYDGRPVFNGYDTVWFVFASHLYEACQTMFIDREAAGAWDSKAYHKYLTTEQQKVPERVWNECYWYDYLRPFENGIETAWIAKLDGGQKIHQRSHFETYEEIYDSSKYRGGVSHNQSITLRGEAIDYQTLGLPEQESKFTITMFNKCYLTIWIGTNYQTVKCEKGVATTLTFYQDNDPSKGYMSLANSVIDIDSGSMVQTIGDLSRIYPSSGQFGKAKRLRSLYLGSSTEGYYNPVFGTSEQLGLNNQMLEYLYVQNLPQARYSLNLSACPELKYLDARGSGFTGFVFANGGLLNEAYVNAPASLVMRNLDALTNANFHLTTPTSVTSLRLENCSLFDNYTFINQLTNLSILRLTNIDWTLNNNTLLDRLLGLMGIDEQGNATTQSYLAGEVSLTGTVYEGDYNRYTAAWSPDLIIDTAHAAQFVQQHLVTFKDEDNNTIYECYIDHGSLLIDPYYNNLLSDVPTKDADLQYSYSFGEIDNAAQYIAFSGWRIDTDSQSVYRTYDNSRVEVNGVMTLYTVFRTTKQRYTVRWLVRNQVVYSTPSPQNYGDGYDLAIPTIADIQAAGQNTYEFRSSGNNCTYSIISGWDKLPTNITPTVVGGTYDINATWLTRENVPYTTVLSSDEYSVAEKLLVLKEMTNARSTLSIRDLFPVKMGYDGIKPAIDLLSAPKRYTGVPEEKNYTPFAVNKSFTLAIDYKFEHKTSTVADEAVLVSCYSEAGGSKQGFKLFYNPKPTYANPVPQISFGDTASANASNYIRTIGKGLDTRGMVVLRHRANDPYLYIYCGSDSGGLTTTYSSSSFRKTINWSAIASDAKIVLGGTNITDNNSLMNATGTIYSAKYWEEDLGEGECLQLASWCHETINFAVQDFDGYSQHNAINGSLNAKVVLHALNASEMGTVSEPVIDRSNSTVGWDPSTVRTFYNSRLRQALPVLLQSVMPTVTVPHRKANFDANQGGYVIASTGTSITNDYVFAPSSIEAGASGTTAENHSIEALRAFPWYNTNQMTVLQYNDGVFNTGVGNANYTNIRFPYQFNKINGTVQVFVGYPNIGSSFYTWINDHSMTLNPGDILIPEDSTVAYIYVGSGDVNKGAPLTTSTYSYLADTVGGWIESVGWWTRSVPDVNSSTNGNKFVWVNALGALTTGNTKEFGLAYSLAI